MSKIEKCIKIALDKSVGDNEALTAFKTARRLSLSDYKPEEGSSKTFTYSSNANEVFSLIGPFLDCSNKLDLILSYSISGTVGSPILSMTVKGSSSSIKSFGKFISSYNNKSDLERFHEYMRKNTYKHEEPKKDGEKKTMKSLFSSIEMPIIIAITIIIFIMSL